jgi:hypothetical protein
MLVGIKINISRASPKYTEFCLRETKNMKKHKKYRILGYLFCIFIVLLFLPQIAASNTDCFMWGFSMTWPPEQALSCNPPPGETDPDLIKINEAIDKTLDVASSASWLRVFLFWKDIEPEIVYEDVHQAVKPGQPVEYDPNSITEEMVDEYIRITTVNWAKYDEIINYANLKGIKIIFVVGAGYIKPRNILPNYRGASLSNSLPLEEREKYYAFITLHVRAAIKHFHNSVNVWQIENELNIAPLNLIPEPLNPCNWRDGIFVYESFVKDLLPVMADAVRKEEIFIRENINSEINIKIYTNFHPLEISDISDWTTYLDFIGLDIYVDKIFFFWFGPNSWPLPEPDVSGIIRSAKSWSANGEPTGNPKPIFLSEVGYNGSRYPLTDTLENEQADWISKSIGYLYYTISTEEYNPDHVVTEDYMGLIRRCDASERNPLCSSGENKCEPKAGYNMYKTAIQDFFNSTDCFVGISVDLILNKNNFIIGEELNATASIKLENGYDVDGATATYNVKNPNNIIVRTGALDPLGNGQYQGSFAVPDIPGNYTIEVTAIKQGYKDGFGVASFIINQPDPRLDAAVEDVDWENPSWDDFQVDIGETISGNILVGNCGSVTTDIPIVLEIVGTGKSATTIVTGVEPGKTKISNLLGINTTGLASGFYTIQIRTDLSGDSNASNNILTRNVLIGQQTIIPNRLPLQSYKLYYRKYAGPLQTTPAVTISSGALSYTITATYVDNSSSWFNISGVGSFRLYRDKLYSIDTDNDGQVDHDKLFIAISGNSYSPGTNTYYFEFQVGIYDENTNVQQINPDRIVNRIALCTGSLSGMTESAKAKYDYYLEPGKSNYYTFLHAFNPELNQSTLDGYICKWSFSNRDSSGTPVGNYSESLYMYYNFISSGRVEDYYIIVPNSTIPSGDYDFLIIQEQVIDATGDDFFRYLGYAHSVRMRVVDYHEAEVTSIVLPPTMRSGGSYTIQVQIKNNGDNPENGIPILLNITNNYGYNLTLNKNSGNIPVGTTQTVDFTWETIGLPSDIYTFSAYISVNGDQNTGNNSKSVQQQLLSPYSLNINGGIDKPEYNEGEVITLNVSVKDDLQNPVSGAFVSYKVKKAGADVNVGVAQDQENGNYFDQFGAPYIPGNYSIEINASKIGYLTGLNNSLTFLVKDSIKPTITILYSPTDNTSISTSQIDFDWSDSVDSGSGVAHYQIQVSKNIDFSINDIDMQPITSNYTATLSPDTYYWRVRSIDNASNQSDWSAVWKFTLDTSAPIIQITDPTTNPTYPTDQPTINIGGTATDNIEVTQVTWSNNRGGNGIASGIDPWSISNINLYSGDNVITVTAKDAANNSGTDTLTVTYTPPDTFSPTPNPMTWATPPHAVDSTSISMEATIATDVGSPPVSYYFDFIDSPTGGTGGADLEWQSSTSYTNTGLQPNQQYGYQVKARDSASTPNETSPSSPVVYTYTLANAPGTAAFSNITETSIRANWTAGGNPAGTQYYCENTTMGTHAESTNTYWASSGLACGTSYSFRVKAINGDGKETSWTDLGSQATLPCPGVLSITPPDGLSSSGPEGGPFTPPSKPYTLENTGNASIDWTASKTQSWVSLSSTSGVLAAGASTPVTVSINSNANGLSAETYNDTVTFTNTTNGNGSTTRVVMLTISSSQNAPPTIDSFTADPSSGPAPLAVAFTCYAHDDGSVVQYQWDFDGDDVVDKTTRSAKASHTYSAAGTYQAKVTVVDNTQETTTSDPLAIAANDVAHLRLINPNGGEIFTAGDPMDILWESWGSDISEVRFFLSVDGGSVYSWIIQHTPDDETFTWVTPDIGTTQAVIKIEALDFSGNVLCNDLSDEVFTIIAPDALNAVKNGDFSYGLTYWDFEDASTTYSGCASSGHYAYAETAIVDGKALIHGYSAYGKGWLRQSFPAIRPHTIRFYYKVGGNPAATSGSCATAAFSLYSGETRVFHYAATNDPANMYTGVEFMGENHVLRSGSSIKEGIVEVSVNHSAQEVQVVVNGALETTFALPQGTVFEANQVALLGNNSCCDGRDHVYAYFDDIVVGGKALVVQNPHVSVMSQPTVYGLKIDTAATIPANLEPYSIVMVERYAACDPTAAGYIEDYIGSGGGVVLYGGTPAEFTAPSGSHTDDLSSIRHWFGAGHYSNAGGLAAVIVDNPLDTTLLTGDVISYCPESTPWAARVDDPNPETTVLAEWTNYTGYINVHIHPYEQGRLIYWADYPTYNDKSLELHDAGLYWLLRGDEAGISLPKALYVTTSANPLITEVLEYNGFDITVDTVIPSDLSGYALVIITVYDACYLETANYLMNYLDNGGGVILTDGTPAYLASPTQGGATADLAAISGWLGAGSYGNVGTSVAHISFDNPFGTGLMQEEAVSLCESFGGAKISKSSLDTACDTIAEWDCDADSVFSFTHTYGKGRLYYTAAQPQYEYEQTSTMLFDGAVKWVAGMDYWYHYPLTITMSPNIMGTVSGLGIDCPGDCTESYCENATITLDATADEGYVFDHWEGCDAASGNECTVIMNSGRKVTANFALSVEQGFRLSPSGLGFGEVLVGSTDQLTLSMYNGKDTDIAVTDVIDPSAPYSITANGCTGATLGPGDACVITVEFVPTSAGNFYDYFLITTDDPSVGTVRVDLSGQGVSE